MSRVVCIPGDGIGPGITHAVRRVIDASGAGIEWIEASAGLATFELQGDPLPQETIEAIGKHRVALKGPLTTPVGSGFRSINVSLRKEFDLYVNLRPVKWFEGVKSLFTHLDLVIFRENTEGLYSGVEHYIDSRKSAAESVAIVTRYCSERIIRAAFEYARKHARKKVTIVHKANILKFTSGMFLGIGQALAKEYPDIECDDKIVDNMVMQLVMNPERFDVIVTTNLFGDILSDLACGLIGGLGLAPGANIGDDTAIFEAVHGSATDIAGKNIANPSALLLAGVLMLRHLGKTEHAEKIEGALVKVLKDGTSVTPDLNREQGVHTDNMADAIIANL